MTVLWISYIRVWETKTPGCCQWSHSQYVVEQESELRFVWIQSSCTVPNPFLSINICPWKYENFGPSQENHSSRTFFLRICKVQEVPHSQFHHEASSAWGSAQLPEKMDGYAVMRGISLDYKLENHFKDEWHQPIQWFGEHCSFLGNWLLGKTAQRLPKDRVGGSNLPQEQ